MGASIALLPVRPCSSCARACIITKICTRAGTPILAVMTPGAHRAPLLGGDGRGDQPPWQAGPGQGQTDHALPRAHSCLGVIANWTQLCWLIALQVCVVLLAASRTARVVILGLQDRTLGRCRRRPDKIRCGSIASILVCRRHVQLCTAMAPCALQRGFSLSGYWQDWSNFRSERSPRCCLLAHDPAPSHFS